MNIYSSVVSFLLLICTQHIKMSFQIPLVFFLAVGILSVIFANEDGYIFENDGDKGPLSNDCIDCMCEVLGCPRMTSCDEYCGPFYIGYRYWQIAFDKDANQFQEFRNCTLNDWCSVRTVQNYMKQTLQGCIGSTSPNDTRSVCEMAMVLHRFGGTKCNTTNMVTESYTREIRECMARRAQPSGNTTNLPNKT